MSDRIKYEIVFSKKGVLKYISHLDLVNLFSRAIRRSNVSVYYTQGYNPKIKISFQTARPVGQEICEDTATIFLKENLPTHDVKEIFSCAFPEGIIIHDIKKDQA